LNIKWKGSAWIAICPGHEDAWTPQTKGGGTQEREEKTKEAALTTKKIKRALGSPQTPADVSSGRQVRLGMRKRKGVRVSDKADFVVKGIRAGQTYYGKEGTGCPKITTKKEGRVLGSGLLPYSSQRGETNRQSAQKKTHMDQALPGRRHPRRPKSQEGKKIKVILSHPEGKVGPGVPTPSSKKRQKKPTVSGKTTGFPPQRVGQQKEAGRSSARTQGR